MLKNISDIFDDANDYNQFSFRLINFNTQGIKFTLTFCEFLRPRVEHSMIFSIISPNFNLVMSGIAGINTWYRY